MLVERDWLEPQIEFYVLDQELYTGRPREGKVLDLLP